MNVHNIMEDVVTVEVNKLYDELKKSNINWLTCDCESCRMDTISYVLNHIPPKYVVSGRGVNHSSEVLNDHQIKADIEAFALEGTRIVSGTKRPFHTANSVKVEISTKPSFNFPIITGSILDGTTFEPIGNAKVELKYHGTLLEMIDKTWQNPFITYKGTQGTYNFWIKPMESGTTGVSKKFDFTIEVSAEGYSPSVLHIEVPVTSEETSRSELNSTYSIKLKEIVLFKDE